MDTSHQKQLCLCLRFIDCVNDKHAICEEFSQPLATEEEEVDLTNEGLADKIKISKLSILCSHDLDVQHPVGQRYDGVALMAGRFSSVQKKIR